LIGFKNKYCARAGQSSIHPKLKTVIKMTAENAKRALAKEILCVVKEHLGECDPVSVNPDPAVETTKEDTVAPVQNAVVLNVWNVPQTIVDKNKADEIDLFFAGTGKAAWLDILDVAVERPLYIVQEVFKRAPEGSLKMTMSRKMAIVATCLSTKKSDLARFFLNEFAIDVKSMQDRCTAVKWGDLSTYDSGMCKELIERFDLPKTCFTDYTKVLSIGSMTTLQWVIERFQLDTVKVEDELQSYYDIFRGVLRANNPEVFEMFIENFCTLVNSLKFGRIYVNADESRNLLRDCYNLHKMEQFDCLVKHFKTPDFTLLELFKSIVGQTPSRALDPRTFKYFFPCLAQQSL